MGLSSTYEGGDFDGLSDVICDFERDWPGVNLDFIFLNIDFGI
jgi:hypothetical protein